MAGTMEKDREPQKITTVPPETGALKGKERRQNLSLETATGEKLVNPLLGTPCKKLSAEFVASLWPITPVNHSGVMNPEQDYMLKPV